MRQSSLVRRAGWQDVDAILDLLTEYDLPRSYFAPFYRDDPTYRPEQSWLVEADGTLLAHLRVYDRQIRVGPSAIRVAGIGNVITARAARGRGYAGQLLRAVRSELPAEGYAYSLLWTHLPDLYARYGWAPIDQPAADAELRNQVSSVAQVSRFEMDDLRGVMGLYERLNAGRTGTTVRTAEYWRGQLTWLGEDRAGFLVARADDGEVLGYVRSRLRPEFVELLELGCNDLDLGRMLLGEVAQRRNGTLHAQLPPSLWDVFRPEERRVVRDPGLMGSRLDSAALEPVWRGRDTSGTLSKRQKVVEQLDEATFGRLLFHGHDGSDDAVLRALFPPQDFVIWPADAF